MEATLPTEVKIGTAPAQEITGAIKMRLYATTVVVNDNATYQLAGHELQEVKARHDRIEAERVKLKQPVLDAGRAIDAFFKNALEPLREAETILKQTMLTYSEAQERIAEEARLKAEEGARQARLAAERKAREEREKAAAEAQRQREEAARRQREADEAERVAREARERGDREAASAADRQRKVAEEAQRKAEGNAQKAEEKGDAKAAAALADAAQIAALPVVTVEAPSAKGVSVRSKWKHKMLDFKKLVDAVSAGKVPLATLLPDEKVLDRAATSLKGEMKQFYPGVEAVEEKGLAASTRR